MVQTILTLTFADVIGGYRHTEEGANLWAVCIDFIWIMKRVLTFVTFIIIQYIEKTA